MNVNIWPPDWRRTVGILAQCPSSKNHSLTTSRANHMTVSTATGNAQEISKILSLLLAREDPSFKVTVLGSVHGKTIKARRIPAENLAS